MPGLDRIVLLEVANWESDIFADPMPNTDTVTFSERVWANKRDLGESLYVVGNPDPHVATIRRVEYTIRTIPSWENYLRAQIVNLQFGIPYH